MKKKIVFFGTPPQAAEILQEFLDAQNLEIVAVVTNPDRPVGRKKILTPTAVKIVAIENNIPVVTPEKFSDAEEKNLKKFSADFFVIVAFGTLIPQKIIDIPKFGTFNLHFSLLPKWRGATPIQSALLAGEKISGISIFKLVHAMDAGEIFVQEKILLEENGYKKNHQEVWDEMRALGKKKFIDLCENFENPPKGSLWDSAGSGKIQDETQATFCGKFTKADGEVDPKKNSAEEIMQKYRAYCLWPKIFSFDINRKRLKWIKIQKSSDENFDKKNPGEIFQYEKKVLLQTKQGVLEIVKAQKEGKKEGSGECVLRVEL